MQNSGPRDLATGGEKQLTFRTAWAQRTVRPLCLVVNQVRGVQSVPQGDRLSLQTTDGQWVTVQVQRTAYRQKLLEPPPGAMPPRGLFADQWPLAGLALALALCSAVLGAWAVLRRRPTPQVRRAREGGGAAADTPPGALPNQLVYAFLEETPSAGSDAGAGAGTTSAATSAGVEPQARECGRTAAGDTLDSSGPW